MKNTIVRYALNQVGPGFMSIAVAPKSWAYYLEESRDYLKNFILEYDKRRNKIFLNVFPEYKFIFA